ncbi:MAG: ribosome small subunit-dependent GTPase A [Clostridia bacterium]|nr:ribosome small subunit-dependent GTPase A [Clostridia bacterium]MBQ8289468.1 ribosome small subunit-dependent GTPase A [Clostridia bacterium]
MIIKKTGRVIKGLGGLYSILVGEGESRECVSCRAKGVLHKDENKLLIGDRVTVTYDTELPDSVVVSEILTRKNALIRPPIANLDLLFITIAAKKPTPALDVVDKLIAISIHNNITPVLIITKQDLSDKDANTYAEIYRTLGIDTFITSAERGEGVPELRDFVASHIKDGITAAFAGASGVGKSTLMNALFPSLSLSVGSISAKIERGRHTTRHVELFEIGEGGGFLADTPGFSLIDFARFDFFALEDLEATFPDIMRYKGACRYADCTHSGESACDCAVAKAALAGEISQTRLTSYRELYKILKQKKNAWS